jgi:hypothetical protein
VTTPIVTAVSRSATHTMTKPNEGSIELIAGIGVAGDAHAGATVKHRSRVARDPNQPNLRQVHLIHAELLEELASAGFKLCAGEMGENVTTSGIDLLGLQGKAVVAGHVHDRVLRQLGISGGERLEGRHDVHRQLLVHVLGQVGDGLGVGPPVAIVHQLGDV